MPIRLRLALLCTSLVLVVVGIGGLLFTNVLHRDLLRQIDGELRSRADSAAAALRAGAPPSAEASQVVGPQDLFVQVTTGDGAILASSGTALSQPLLSPAELRAAAAAATPVQHTLPTGTDRQTPPDQLRLLVEATHARGSGYVVVAATLDPIGDALSSVTRELLITAALVAPLAAAGAWALAGAALRPVERLRRDVARISARDPGSRVRTPGTRDELAALATTMNALLERLQAALARERRLVADAAHELRSPLAILRTELELAGRRGRTREELIDAVASAAEETDRLVRLAEDLLFLARTDEGVPVLRPEPVTVGDLVDDAVTAYATRAAEAGVALRVSAPGNPVAVLDEVRIRQAVGNLIDNALRMAPRGTAVGVTVGLEDGMVVISISDAGPGFPPDFIGHAFERFRRADTSRARNGGGAGLGLAIVEAIARTHGGRAEAANRADGGATVSLAVPIAGPPDLERT